MYTGYAGSVVGALAQFGTGMYNNHFNAKQARASDSRSYRYSKKLSKWNALNLPSLQRQGLEAAGYNPMLALGNIGGASAGMSPSHSATSNMSFDGSSAKELGKFFEEMAKDKVAADVENVKADTALKEGQLSAVESQRLQNEANTSLLMSQTERNDLAYGRDIVDTITGIAGTGASLYSAKAFGDAARSNAASHERNATVNERRLNQHSYEVMRDKKGNRVGSRERVTSSRGVPSVSSSAKGVPPNVQSGLGNSAKNAGKIAAQIAKEIILPLAIAAPIANEGRKASDRIQSRKDKKERYWTPRRVLLH